MSQVDGGVDVWEKLDLTEYFCIYSAGIKVVYRSQGGYRLWILDSMLGIQFALL